MFYAGSNIPGYLPVADAPNTFATFADAKAWLLEELGADDTERGDAMSAIAEDLNLCGSHGETEFYDVAYAVDDEGAPLANDQGIAYWITWKATDCAHCGQQATVVGEDPRTWEDLPLCEECDARVVDPDNGRWEECDNA